MAKAIVVSFGKNVVSTCFTPFGKNESNWTMSLNLKKTLYNH